VPPIVRSILAIVAGFMFIGALAGVTGTTLQTAGIFPAAGEPVTDIALVLLETAYVAIFAIAGCWLAALIAPSRPMRHALILGLLGLAFNVMGAVATWGQRPVWSVLVNLALTMLYAWVGGRLREMQIERGRLSEMPSERERLAVS
jgi:hypothetical protein